MELTALESDGVKITPESQKKKNDLIHVAKRSWFCKACLYRRGKMTGLVIHQEGVCLSCSLLFFLLRCAITCRNVENKEKKRV